MSQPKKSSKVVKKSQDTFKKMREELKHHFYKVDHYEEKIEPGHILYGFNYEHLSDEEVEALFEALDLESDEEDDDVDNEHEKKAYIA